MPRYDPKAAEAAAKTAQRRRKLEDQIKPLQQEVPALDKKIRKLCDEADKIVFSLLALTGDKRKDAERRLSENDVELRAAISEVKRKRPELETLQRALERLK
jgi:DNA repair exonuclease SbcCD ATPase subunit